MDDLVVAAPGLIGIFWGRRWSPRVRDRHFRLAWTQGISRTRWLAVKLGVVGALSMIVAGLFSALATAWSRPLEQAS